MFSDSHPFLKQILYVGSYSVNSVSRSILPLSDTLSLTADPATNLIHKDAI